MSKIKVLADRVAIHVFINRALDTRLENFTREVGWSKTKVVEQALATWLNQREAEVK